MIEEFTFQEQDFDLVPLQEEASTRRYFKAKLRENPSIEYSHKFKQDLTLCKDIQINYDFIELSNFLLQNNIFVPEVLAIDKHKSIILQEYLGTSDLYSEEKETYLNYLFKAIDILIQLQKIQPNKLVASRYFDFEKLNFEIQLTLSSLRKLEISLKEKVFITSEFEIFLEETCKHLDKQEPKVFTHRDFHSRNIMIYKNQLYLIDFQDARMGLPVYDLASLIYDAYKPLEISERKSLIAYFVEKSGIKKKGFYDTFYLQALQRSFKALGTYIIQINDKKNYKFLPSLYSCLDNLEEISQLGQFPDSVYLFIVDLRNKIKLNPEFNWV